MQQEILLGFSGGIDSTASVELLQKAGYRVRVLTLDTTGDRQLIDNARAKAEELGVEIIVDDVRELFQRKVVDYFTESYMCGETPAPCTLCNPNIKWRRLAEVADELGIEKIATGHYFRVTEHAGRKYVTRGIDPVKDQSYYLWGLTQSVLRRIVTPMGEMIKDDIKVRFGVAPSARESMGVCFLGGRGYGELLREKFGDRIAPGDIVDKNGVVMGRHQGFPYYTIGQKRGFELFDTGDANCIIGIDPAANRLIAGNDTDLYHSNLVVFEYNIVDMNELVDSADITVKIRGLGRNPDGFARVTVDDDCGRGRLHVALSQPAWAASKGQPVVFYRDERVIGGGILEKYF